MTVHMVNFAYTDRALSVGGTTSGSYPSEMIVALVITIGAVALLGIVRWHGRSPVIMGADNRLSTSKTLALLWLTFVLWVFGTDAAIALFVDPKTVVQIQSPPTDQYLLLLGGPFAALVAAKGIVSNRLANGSLQKTPGDGMIKPLDLINDDAGNADLVDLQFTLFNVVALTWCVISFTKNVSSGLPEIPAGLSALTSVSALTYIGNKTIQQNTPTILSIVPSAARIGDSVVICGSNLAPSMRAGATAEAFLLPVVTIGDVRAVTEGNRATIGTSIVVTVPEGVPVDTMADVRVTAYTTSNGSGSDSMKLRIDKDKIRLSSATLSPDGNEVTIVGEYLTSPGVDGVPPTVTFGGVPAKSVTIVGRDRLIAALPDNAQKGKMEVAVSRQQLSDDLTIAIN